jgi:hypothetical protein
VSEDEVDEFEEGLAPYQDAYVTLLGNKLGGLGITIFQVILGGTPMIRLVTVC